MVVAAIGVAAMSADARSQLRKYRNQPAMAPMTNHNGIERMTKNTTHIFRDSEGRTRREQRRLTRR